MDKKYSNTDIIVYWKPEKCIHSRKCFTSLGSVFDPRKKPWVNMEGASTQEIIEVVSNCPSGALSYSKLDESVVKTNEVHADEVDVKIKPLQNGPIEITGECMIIDANGVEKYQTGKFFLCRCGASSNKPFCDGTHRKVNFIG